MAEQTHIQRLRGNTAKNDVYTGLAGELTINTDSKSLRVHDGLKQGGYGTIRAAHIDGDLPSSVPVDFATGAHITCGDGPLAGADLTPVWAKLQELEDRLDAIVTSKEVAAYDVIPATVPEYLSSEAIAVVGSGPLE